MRVILLMMPEPENVSINDKLKMHESDHIKMYKKRL